MFVSSTERVNDHSVVRDWDLGLCGGRQSLTRDRDAVPSMMDRNGVSFTAKDTKPYRCVCRNAGACVAFALSQWVRRSKRGLSFAMADIRR